MNTKRIPTGTRLIPMDLEQDIERQELHKHRLICGWNSEMIETWREEMRKGERTLFWITISGCDNTTDLTPLKKTHDALLYPVGHISLDKVDDPPHPLPPDDTLVAPDGSILSISKLFVLPRFAGLGLGAFALEECERMAQREPYGSLNCRAVTLNTMSSRYLANGEDGPEGMGRWALIGEQIPKRDNSIWYSRRGYVRYKEEIRYFIPKLDGTMLSWYGVFMRKELQGARS